MKTLHDMFDDMMAKGEIYDALGICLNMPGYDDVIPLLQHRFRTAYALEFGAGCDEVSMTELSVHWELFKELVIKYKWLQMGYITINNRFSLRYPELVKVETTQLAYGQLAKTIENTPKHLGSIATAGQSRPFYAVVSRRMTIFSERVYGALPFSDNKTIGLLFLDESAVLDDVDGLAIAIYENLFAGYSKSDIRPFYENIEIGYCRSNDPIFRTFVIDTSPLFKGFD